MRNGGRARHPEARNAERGAAFARLDAVAAGTVPQQASQVVRTTR